MDRRSFFGSIAALVVGTALPGRRLPYEAPTLTPLGVVNPKLVALIQERTLARVFRDTVDYRRMFSIEVAAP